MYTRWRSKQPGDPSRIRLLAGGVSILALWVLHRPYRGIVHDARIYIGRALAQLDPGGIGQDLMFRLDEQSQFSALPPLVEALTELLGPNRAAIILTLAGMALWLAAAALLVTRLVDGRMRWVALLAIAVLPSGYAGLNVFQYGEPFVTPRLFAEAAALAGLALFLDRRWWICGALLAASAAVHPLMALPALAVVGLMLVWDDRRWLVALGVFGAVFAGAAAVGLPVADRLLSTIDPAWRRILDARNQYLFPSRWQLVDLGVGLVQLTTVFIAAHLTQPPVKRFLLSTGYLVVAGTAFSVVFVDLASNLLAAQLQLWRSLWLLAVLANAAIPIVTRGLWQAGRSGRLVLAIGASAWILSRIPPLGLPLLTATLLALAFHHRGRGEPPRSVLRVAWTMAGVAFATWMVSQVTVLIEIAVHAQAIGTHITLARVTAGGVFFLPLMALALAWTIGDFGRLERISHGTLVAGALGLALLAGLFWDDRSDYRAKVEQGRLASGPLTDLPQQATLMWIDGDIEPWLLAGAPNWASGMQGAGAVFSRDLAFEWNRRMVAMVQAGLVPQRQISPFEEPIPSPRRMPSAASLRNACSVSPGPSNLVVTGSVPPDIESQSWDPGAAVFRLRRSEGDYSWQRYDTLALVNCARLAPP